MLECTMGCPSTFETRRAELATLKLIEPNLITDDAVTASFLESVDPKGDDAWMLEYVKLGNFMLLFGDSLFLHGGLSTPSLGHVPGAPDVTDDPDEVDAEEWCRGLNGWKDDMVRAYCKDPRGINHQPLLDYGVPNGNKGRTVVYSGHVVNGNCAAPDVGVEEFCEVNNIRRVLLGHTPHGECPSVIKRPSTTIFMCDTSRSDNDGNKAMNPSNFRGVAVTMVTVKRDVTRVEGVLKDGGEKNGGGGGLSSNGVRGRLE